MRTFIRQPSKIPVEISTPKKPAGKSQLLKNISFGGLCYRTGEPIEPGTQVNIRLPTLDPGLETRGRISWCRRKNNDIEIGIQFLDKDSEHRLRIVEQICDIERSRKEATRPKNRLRHGRAPGRKPRTDLH